MSTVSGESDTKVSVGESTTPKKAPKVVKRLVRKQPWEGMLAENPSLQKAVSVLPSNYEFEIPKCLYKIKEANAKVVALQMPEGLLFCACIISDIFRQFAEVRVFLLGDVTYGACCIDDFTAEKLGADLLIHYGHSCLVPIQQTRIKTVYVFVEIYFDISHLVSILKHNFPTHFKLSIQGTVQFLRAVAEVSQQCSSHFARIDIPQCKPLSPGETLGCTSAPLATDIDAAVFIADGRFHMEATMIRNHHLASVGNDRLEPVHFYRYDPYAKVMSEEKYDTPTMVKTRKASIDRVLYATSPVRVFGVILGTLGRQGNSQILNRLTEILESKGKIVIKFLMAELAPWKLKVLSSQIDCWVQIACPRLSIDWAAREYEGDATEEENVLCGKPVLTPYECMVAVGHVPWQATMKETIASDVDSVELRRKAYAYPMDYYSGEQNPWNNYYKDPSAPKAEALVSTNSRLPVQKTESASERAGSAEVTVVAEGISIGDSL